MVKLTTAQRAVLEKMTDGERLRVKSGGFFPGAWLGNYTERVNANTARSLMDRLLIRQVDYSPRDGSICQITDSGRAALAARDADDERSE
jgi:hypothetical protein